VTLPPYPLDVDSDFRERADPAQSTADGGGAWPPSGDARPWTRWWWLNGPFRDEHIEAQLRWLASQGFGGVEIAWLHPGWEGDIWIDRPKWLGEEWSRLVAFAKSTAVSLGLGCDLTFGSAWPFGGSCVTPEDAAQTFHGPSPQTIGGSWEEPLRGRVLDHLSSAALGRYFEAMAPAFSGGLAGTRSALFCDSLEVRKDGLWSPGLWAVFESRYGYALRPHLDELRADPGILYDYKLVLGEAILREFYEAFTARCHAVGAYSRVQCHGAPTDLLAAYAAVDVPESETLLFPPAFSRIPASAAALGGRLVVSCETFTCIYGFPGGPDLRKAVLARRQERTADLRLLADAVFANGVNQIVWHGTPYDPPDSGNSFYASVHVGLDSPFLADLPEFNAYLARVSSLMREGRTCSRLAVYLPNEDMMLAGDLPESQRVPGATDFWEMRTVRLPPGTEGYAPIWISRPFLAKGEVVDGRLHTGATSVPALLIDVDWLDAASLVEIHRLARLGLPTAVLRRPRQPGYMPDSNYEARLDELLGFPTVVRSVAELPVQPLVEGEDLPWFWARECSGEVFLFFAHPAARAISYPMPLGMADEALREERHVVIRVGETSHDATLVFEPGRSIALRAGGAGVREVALSSPVTR